MDRDRHSGRAPGGDRDGDQGGAAEVKVCGSNTHTNQTVKHRDTQSALSTLHGVVIFSAVRNNQTKRSAGLMYKTLSTAKQIKLFPRNVTVPEKGHKNL